MTDFERKILIFLGLWLLLSVICTIIICVVIEHREKKMEKKRAEFEKEWNKYGRNQHGLFL